MTSGFTPTHPRMEAVGPCPVCGASGGRPFLEGPDRLHGVPGTYRYRRCRSCSSVYQDPRVVDEDLHLVYPDDYYTHDSGVDPATLPTVWTPSGGIRGRIRRGILEVVAPEEPLPGPNGGLHRILARSRWLRERAFYDLAPDEMLPWRRPSGRALDVGCGSGAHLLRLAELGWQAEGTEWDEKAAGVAATRTGLPVHQGGVDELDPALGPFDLITLVHVFEHLPRPRTALSALARLLDSGGRLVLVYPNPDALGARRFGSFWFAWDAPRHLVFPSMKGLRELVQGTGLRLRSARTLSRWAPMHALHSRAYRRGQAPGALEPGPGDQAFHLLERLLTGARAPVGEEIVVSFEGAG